jgi:hypothetical protein
MVAVHDGVMNIKLSLRQKLAAVGVAGAVILGAGGAVAYAQTTGPTTTTPPASSSTNSPSTGQGQVARAGLRALARRAVHGDVTVKDKDGQFVTVTFDRGTVTAASATSITLQRPDDQIVTLTVDANTKVHGPASAAAVQTGKTAVVVSRGGTATQILQPKNA